MGNGQKRSEWGETLLGFGIILIGIASIAAVSYYSYTKFSSPSQLSLSAYYVDESGTPVNEDSPNYERSHLKIRGDVFQADQPVKSGDVRLTLRTGDESFRQSITIPLKDGHFETEDPAFFSIRPGAQVVIMAEVSSSQPSLKVSDRIDLNSAHPESKLALELLLGAGFVLLTIVFLYSFTGKKTPRKNRTAIIFSYVIIGVFLAVPILAPVVLFRTFPSAADAMIGQPAGLVNTNTAMQHKDQSEWALNIGGYSYEPPAAAPTLPETTPTAGTDAASNTISKEGSTPSTIGTASTTSTGRPSENAAQSLQPTTNTQPLNAPTATWRQRRSSRSVRSVSKVVKVEGGLVIPLYVIILSVIGGAINMTRKVPVFQKEGEESDFSIVRPISSLGTAVLEKLTSGGQADKSALLELGPAVSPQAGHEKEKSELPLEDQAAKFDAQIDPLVVEQVKRNCDTGITVSKIGFLVLKVRELYKAKAPDERLLKFNSFEDWFGSHPRLREVLGSNWRVELLNQYMYLISAPFLAIVTYYIIDLLGLTKLGKGVVVVLSFSVGLISEKIVTWILGIASGYLRTDSTSNPAKAA